MSKALEKLYSKAIKNPDSNYCEMVKCYDKVKSALKRKEKLEKEQEELIEHNNYLSNQVDILTKENEKLEKVWNIVKEKEVNTADFRESILSFDMTYKHYVSNYKNYSWELLTEAEFDLLKEMLR